MSRTKADPVRTFNIAEWAGPNADAAVKAHLTEQLSNATKEQNCFTVLGDPLSKASRGSSPVQMHHLRVALTSTFSRTRHLPSSCNMRRMLVFYGQLYQSFSSGTAELKDSITSSCMGHKDARGMLEARGRPHIVTFLQEETLTHWPKRKCYFSKDWENLEELKKQTALKAMAVEEVKEGDQVRADF